MATNQNVQYTFTADVTSALSGINKLQKSLSGLSKMTSQIGKFGNSLGSLGSVKKTLSSVTGLLTGSAVAKTMQKNAESAIDYVETLNLYQTALKDAADAGTEFIDKMSDMYGLDPAYLAEWTGRFYEMGAAVNMPTEAAQKFSQGLSVLTTDLSSLLNLDFETTANKMASGMRGMSKAALELNMDLRATTVQAYAASEGINVKMATANEATREILRYAAAVDQATDAEGDFARTIESPANQLRVFKEQCVQVGRAIGNFIVAPLASVLPYINAFVMTLKVLLNALAEFLGVTKWIGSANGNVSSSFDDASDSIAGVGTSADKSKKKLKNLVSQFDELNVLQDPSSTSSSGSSGGGAGWGEVDPAVLGLLDKVNAKLTDAKMKAVELRDAFLDFLGIDISDGFNWDFSVFEENLEGKFPEWKQTIQSIFDVDWSDAWEQAKNIFSTLFDITQLTFENVVQDLLGLFGIDISDESVAEFFNTLNANLNDFSTWLDDHQEDIVNTLTKIVEAFLLFKAISAITPLISTFLTIFSKIPTLFGTLFTVVGSVVSVLGTLVEIVVSSIGGVATGALAIFIAGFISGFMDIWKNSEQFRENISTLFSNIGNLLSQIVQLVILVVKKVIEVVKPIVKTIGQILQPVYTFIVGLVNSIVGIVTGVIDVISGILNGDLTQVMKGFMKIIMGLVEAVMNMGAAVVNGIISAIVSGINAIGRMLSSVVNGVIGVANSILGALDLKKINKPKSSLFTIEKVPQIVPPAFDYKFASGGVVTGPTRALIGEAGRSEAVLPLDDSPQMKDLIKQIADAVTNQGNQKEPVKVQVYLDGREMTHSQNRTNRKYGRTQQNI